MRAISGEASMVPSALEHVASAADANAVPVLASEQSKPGGSRSETVASTESEIGIEYRWGECGE